MKYNNINELDNRLENIIKRTVKHYLTDWTNYDRPKLESLKASEDRKDKKMILIARKCGTYLLTLEAIENNESTATIYSYFYQQETGDYYFIDLEALEVKKINPETFTIKTYKAA